MKTKQIAFLCVLCVSCLFIGIISTIIIFKRHAINTSNEIKNIVYNQLNSNTRFIDILSDRIIGIDTNTSYVKEYNNVLYFYSIYQPLREDVFNNKINTIYYEKLVEFIEYRVEILKSDSSLLNIIKTLWNDNLSTEERLFRLDIVANQICQEYLLYIHTHAIPIYGKIINYAKKDTVNFGEIYQSEILFGAFGFGNNLVVMGDNDTLKDYISMENGDTLKDYIFKEKALKLGHNHRSGYYTFFTENGFAVYEVDINYFVK
jgi:hypothetical protein